MKAGSSTLHDYLSLHPDISTSKIKELDYFLWNYNKGPYWYKSHFTEDKKYRVESSPNYTKFYKDWEYSAKKMHKDVPNCKLIYILRNPTERTLSQCRHHEINPNKFIPELLKSDQSHEILTNSKYHLHIEEFLKYFQKDQLLILKMETLTNEPEESLEKVSSFLSIKPFNLEKKIHSNDSKKYSHSGKIIIFLNNFKLYNAVKKKLRNSYIKKIHKKIFYRPHKTYPVLPEVRESLNKYFRNDIEELEEVTSLNFSEWKK